MENEHDASVGLECPIPRDDYDSIHLAHGGGGKLTNQLIRSRLLPIFKNETLSELHDGAVVSIDGLRLAFSTDSYVVHPLFFPGGDIGSLAVFGTTNDLAMCGATPLAISAAFIIEEGFSMRDLDRIAESMHQAALRAGVQLVTGDTKVVDRGKGDGIFINTSGIGVVKKGIDIRPKRAAVGDRIILSGPIGLHGIAIMAAREGLEFQASVRSDSADLSGLVEAMLDDCPDIHVLRDPTRGGVASALNEIAQDAGVGILIHEEKISVPGEVAGACELLGLDPLYVANEGKLIAFVPPDCAESVVSTMRRHPLGTSSAVIGEVTATPARTVLMRTQIRTTRVVDMLSGEQLPRIC